MDGWTDGKRKNLRKLYFLAKTRPSAKQRPKTERKSKKSDRKAIRTT